MTTPTRLQVRVDDADVPAPAAVTDLVERCRAADDHGPFGEHTLLTLDGHRQVRHARLACSSGEDLVGYAVLSEGLDAWYLEVAVDPARRGQGAGAALVEAAAGHVAGHGGGTVKAWAHGGGPAVERLAARWQVCRTLHVLQRPLVSPLPAPVVPDGLVLRTLDTASYLDREAWLGLTRDAFAGDPENGGWSRADVDWRMDAGWTSGACFPVLTRAGRLVAGVWTKLGEAGSAELYLVAVAGDEQGRGLGGVVVAEALRLLARHGWTRADLYVDASNTPALALYSRAGFTPHHTDRCYAIEV